MKTITTIALLLITIIGTAQIDAVVIDSTPYTRYAVISINDYYNINANTSQKKGYKLGNKTERIYPMDIQQYCYDKDSVLKVALKVYPVNQIDFEFPLLDITEINFVDTVLEDIEVELIDQKTFDWFARHYEKTGDKTKRWIFINDKIDNGRVPDAVRDKLKVK